MKSILHVHNLRFYVDKVIIFITVKFLSKAPLSYLNYEKNKEDIRRSGFIENS